VAGIFEGALGVVPLVVFVVETTNEGRSPVLAIDRTQKENVHVLPIDRDELLVVHEEVQDVGREHGPILEILHEIDDPDHVEHRRILQTGMLVESGHVTAPLDLTDETVADLVLGHA